MAIMADLDDLGVADLLHILSLRGTSGYISVHADGNTVRLMIDGGRLVWVTSSDATLRLGRMLVRHGMLRQPQLDLALREQQLAIQRQQLGTLLVERGWIQPSDLIRCVEIQCIEILARVIVAKQGSISFTRSPLPPLSAGHHVINADRILLEAIRRSDEMAALRDRLPSPTTPLMIADRQIDELADTEYKVLATLQSGSTSLIEITEHLAMDELAIWRSVLDLLDRGLLLAGDCSYRKAYLTSVDALDPMAELQPFTIGELVGSTGNGRDRSR